MLNFGEDALQTLIRRVKNIDPDRNHDRALWNILSALRGPDNGSDAEKNEYTGPIRAWISQGWTRAVGSSTRCSVPSLKDLEALHAKVHVECPPTHYYAHIAHALTAMIMVMQAEKPSETPTLSGNRTD